MRIAFAYTNYNRSNVDESLTFYSMNDHLNFQDVSFEEYKYIVDHAHPNVLVLVEYGGTDQESTINSVDDFLAAIKSMEEVRRIEQEAKVAKKRSPKKKASRRLTEAELNELTNLERELGVDNG